MRLRTVALVSILFLIIAVACGGNGGDGQEPTATTPPGAAATDTPAAEVPTEPPQENRPTATTARTASFSLCLLEPEEADEALGEFVTGFPGGNLSCTYQTDSGIYARFELGSPDDLQPDADFEGVPGEPVAGIGEEAVWFSGVQLPSHHFDFDEVVTLGVLSLRQDDVHLRIMLNLPALDSATQLELVTGLAAIAISRLP